MAGILESLLGTGAEAMAKRQALANSKKGKTPEQKEAIDFFAEEYAEQGCGCFGRRTKIISMNEYMNRVQERCRRFNLRAKALEKLGIDESQICDVDPIFLHNFVFDSSDKNLYWKIEDNTVVTSKYSITWIFFSQTQMYTYTYTFDMTSDNVVEYMKEFFYQDITAFETESELVEKIDSSIISGCFSSKESHVKNNYTVDWFRVVVPGSTFSVTMRNAGSQIQSVQAAKALLRDRKFDK